MNIIIFQIVVLIFSVVIHEVAHGYTAERLGDPTARLAGRLTLNPLKHLDPFGSVILPLLLAIPAFFGSPTIIFGWAKPVPYNPTHLKNPKVAAGKIAAAGPASNFLIAIIFGMLIRFADASGSELLLSSAPLFSIVVLINILLGVFNLVPIPPLDGSKVLFSLLPATEGSMKLMYFLERYGMMLVIFFIFFGYRFILPIMTGLYYLIVGKPFGF